MEYYSSQISQLVEQLASLPGIGAKTAQRLAFHIIDMPEERVEKLADSIVKAKKTIRYCKECLTLTDKELCPICANPHRNHKVIMVVENALERSFSNSKALRRRLISSSFSFNCSFVVFAISSRF